MSSTDEEERVYTQEETYEYYKKVWKELKFADNPILDYGTYSDLVAADPMVEYGYKYGFVLDKVMYDGYESDDPDSELILYLNSTKLKYLSKS